MLAVRAARHLESSVSCRGYATEITFNYTTTLPRKVINDLRGVGSHEWMKVEGKSATTATSNVVSGKGKVEDVNKKLSASPGVVESNAPSQKGEGGQLNLPTSRTLYTVIRSPFVHKKSREQFHLTVKSNIKVVKMETPEEMVKKLFWLKRTVK